MNNHYFFFNLILILNIITLISSSSSNCGPNFNQDDIPFDIKVQQSPVVLIGTSLNKNFDVHIPNLFNVTYLVRCVLKGSPINRIIRIVQAGSLLGRRFCQRFDVNRDFIAFLEPFFDGTYRPVDLEEIPYDYHVNSLLEQTCGLTRTYPFMESNDTEAISTSKCPSAVSLNCPIETIKSAPTTPTMKSVLSTTKTTGSVIFGKGTIDYAILSLLLADYQRQNNLSLSFLQDENHKLPFSDDIARKNEANKFSSMIITISLFQCMSFIILRLFL